MIDAKVSQEFAEALLRVRPGHIEKVGRDGQTPAEFVIVHRDDWQQFIDAGIVRELGNAPAPPSPAPITRPGGEQPPEIGANRRAGGE